MSIHAAIDAEGRRKLNAASRSGLLLTIRKRGRPELQNGLFEFRCSFKFEKQILQADSQPNFQPLIVRIVLPKVRIARHVKVIVVDVDDFD